MTIDSSKKPLIEIKDLVKKFGSFTALNGVSLDVYPGEVHALLGDNGAGKSTLINVICGIVSPTSGKITVNNFDIISDYRKTRSLIGVVPQELSLSLIHI